MANKKIRQIEGTNAQDPGANDILSYSDQAGSRKISEVGRHLLPLGDGASGFTTDASTARVLPSPGKNLAVYNNSAAVHAVTLGLNNAVPANAAGVATAIDQVGIACPPNAWTYIACAYHNWVRTDSASLLVYIIDDNTYIRPEAPAPLG